MTFFSCALIVENNETISSREGGLEIVRTLMQRQGVTSDRLAEISGVPKSTIDKIASGATDNPRYKSLQKLAGALGLGLDDFIRLAEGDASPSLEDQLLGAFHALNAQGRERALGLLEDMAASGHYPMP